jgi:hypothetical protein
VDQNPLDRYAELARIGECRSRPAPQPSGVDVPVDDQCILDDQGILTAVLEQQPCGSRPGDLPDLLAHPAGSDVRHHIDAGVRHQMAAGDRAAVHNVQHAWREPAYG